MLISLGQILVSAMVSNRCLSITQLIHKFEVVFLMRESVELIEKRYSRVEPRLLLATSKKVEFKKIITTLGLGRLVMMTQRRWLTTLLVTL